MDLHTVVILLKLNLTYMQSSYKLWDLLLLKYKLYPNTWEVVNTTKFLRKLLEYWYNSLFNLMLAYTIHMASLQLYTFWNTIEIDEIENMSK